MNDSEIIKALGCCRVNDKDLNMNKCWGECPYEGECHGKSMQDVLDLIKRQQERIDRLMDSVKGLADESDARDIDEYDTICKMRAEAVAEFAERLKRRYRDFCVDEGELTKEIWLLLRIVS